MAIDERKGVRIISDGTPRGTHVFDSEGVEITGITGIEWSIKSGCAELGVATLTFPLASVDVTGDLKDG